jgi:hypothetical protein
MSRQDNVSLRIYRVWEDGGQLRQLILVLVCCELTYQYSYYV